MADDPSRDKPIRERSAGLEVEAFDRDRLFDLFIFSFPKLKRWAANWARLVLRTYGVDALDWADRSLYRVRFAREIGSRMHMDFDSALGYPGEGPFRFLPRSYLWSAFGSALSFCFLRLRLLCFFLCCFFVASWTSPLSGAI